MSGVKFPGLHAILDCHIGDCAAQLPAGGRAQRGPHGTEHTNHEERLQRVPDVSFVPFFKNLITAVFLLVFHYIAQI